MLIFFFHVIFLKPHLNGFLQAWFLLFHSMKSLINHQKEVIMIFSPAFLKINSFEGQKYLNSINIFTELPKALLIILFILNLLSLFYIKCFGIHCMLDSFYFKNCFNIVRLLKMFALMIPVFLINISLLDYFSNNSWNHFWLSQSMSKRFPSFLDQLKISSFIYSHMNSP